MIYRGIGNISLHIVSHCVGFFPFIVWFYLVGPYICAVQLLPGTGPIPNGNKMKVNSEITLRNFNAWSGAKETKNRIIEEGKEDAFDALIEELYPDGIDETHLNDLLWFEEEWIFECLGITEETED